MALQRGLSLTERLQSVSKLVLQRSKSIKVEEFSLTSWQILGVKRCLADDFTHVCMEMHWSRLLGFVLLMYNIVSLAFACLFYFLEGASGLAGDIPPKMSNFEVCWWFATVNIVTAGFGSVVPHSTKAYVISTSAHFVGLLLNALLLGVVVAKASLPAAKMIFSNVVCVRTRNGIQQLMVRIGNARGNVLFSPDIRFAYIRRVTTAEGESYFEDCLLSTRAPAALKPAFTITHPVTRDSPIDGKSEEDIVKERGFFLLIVSATDVETGQSFYARRLYFMKDFRFNHQFMDVVGQASMDAPSVALPPSLALEEAVRETKTIDFLKFHDTVPLDKGCWKEGADVCEPSRRFGILADDAQSRPPQPIGCLEGFDGYRTTDGGNHGYGPTIYENGWASFLANGKAGPVRSYSAEAIGEPADHFGDIGSPRSLRQRIQKQQAKQPSFDTWNISNL